MLTIKGGVLIPCAGIDESNANGYFVLWPKDPAKSAKKILRYLKRRFGNKEIGVVITDSKTNPLRWGTSGIAIGYSGFCPLNNYIGKPDIFGQNMKVTKSNIADALAAASVLIMGEGNEQTPMALIEDIPFVEFWKVGHSGGGIEGMEIPMEEDIYGSLLKSVGWRRCENSNSK